MANEIIHWNIRGLKTFQNINYKNKIDSVTTLLNKNQSTMILNIQETHLTDIKQVPKKWQNYKHIYDIISADAHQEDRFSGILIFINKIFEVVEKVEIVKGRALKVKVINKATLESFIMFSIYGRATGTDKQKSDFYKLIFQKMMV